MANELISACPVHINLISGVMYSKLLIEIYYESQANFANQNQISFN